MGCNCGKKKLTASGSEPTVTLTMPDGDTSEHDTRLSAEAENIRLGGGGKFSTK